MKYYQPYGISDPNAPYINGDPTIGREGSIPPAQSIEHDMREIVAVIEHSALTPQEADLTQLLQAMRSQRLNYALASNTGAGTENQITVAFNPPIADTMTPGMPLRIKAAQNNTGPTNLSVDGIVYPLRKPDGAELAEDDAKTGAIFEAIWNDSGFWEFNNYIGGGGTPGASNTYITKIPYAVDTGAVNALTANFVPAITALAPGDAVEVKLANNITGPTTIVVNGLPVKAIVRPNNAPLSSGDGAAGQIMLLLYSDAGNFQFFGILPQSFSGLGVPVGGLILTLGDSAVPGTLKLNGALLVRAEHPLLWAFANASNRIVNEVDWQGGAGNWTAFSRGDGTTTFRLPDLRAEFMRFWDDTRGIDPARVLGRQQGDLVGNISLSGTVTMNNPKATVRTSAAHWTTYENQHNYEDGELAYIEADGPLTDATAGDRNAYNAQYNNEGPFATELTFVAPAKKSVGGTQWPGYPLAFSHKQSFITGDITLTGYGGGNETRPRNTAIVPCVVDG